MTDLYLEVTYGNPTYNLDGSLHALDINYRPADYHLAGCVSPFNNLGSVVDGLTDSPNTFFTSLTSARSWLDPQASDFYSYYVGVFTGLTYTNVYINEFNLEVLAGLNGKQPLNSNLTALAIQPSAPYGRSLLNTANQAALQTAVGVSTAGLSGAYADLSGKPSLATVATSGAYSDLTGKPSIPSVARTTTYFTPSLVGTGATGTQIDTTKAGKICASFSTSVTVTLGGTPVSRVIAKVCATNSSTESDWVEAGRTGTSQPTTLTVTVGGVYIQEGQICFDVPNGYYYKFVNSGTGTHAEAAITAQKTIYG